MYNFLQHICIVLLPLIVSNVLHMFVVKKDLFPSWKHPISSKLFGNNKTWRGFLVVAITNAFLLYLLNLLVDFQLQYAFFLGFTLGFTYMLFELPNSFLKRTLGIKAGEKAAKNSLLFMLIDKTDSAFGVNLVYYMLGFISLSNAFLLFAICSSVHIIFSHILVYIQLKKSF